MNNLEKGILAENHIANDLKPFFKGMEQAHTWGIDIVINEDQRFIKIEVKSASYFIKNGLKGVRRGKFHFQAKDLTRDIDYFAFVVDKEGKKSTYWVLGDVIRNHFNARKTNTKLALGIPTLFSTISKVDFSEVIGFD